jgi:archaellum biogenesis protein FlaJ (TadC family)
LLVLTGLVACALNLDSTFVREIDLWARICIPASFIVGLVGAVQRNRVVSIVTAVIAWVGITFFLLAVIGTVIPDESIRLTDNPQGPSGIFLAIRFVLLITIGISIAVFFRWLRAAGAAPGVDGPVAR